MPTYLPRRLTRSVGLLVTLVMVAGLLVITPTPTKAADPTPDYLPTFDACPEDVIPDADFSDVSSRHDNVRDIDCIAYYGITRGTGNNRYSPDDPVIREHMALFLIRMAKLVGIDVPAPGTGAFRDIGHLSDESQDNINQLAQLGITVGKGDNRYAPADRVSRGEMALFLTRLMDLMDVPEHRSEVFGYLPADVDDRALEDADVDAPYTDMRERTVAEFDAVEQLYELGVASGVSSRAYGPARDMSRAHMAEFMAAILDHSNLRPQGVTVQLTPSLGWEDYNITAMISARSDDFRPLDNERVDWFYTDDPDGGLQSNGECDQDALIEGDCVWDDDRDDITDDDGNYYEDVRAVSGEVLTFYAWMGDRDGDEFDEDTGDYGRAEAISDKGPERFEITANIPEHAAIFELDNDPLDGAYLVDRDVQRSISLTIQLEDGDGRVLEREGLEIAVEIEEFGGGVGTDEDTSMFTEVTWSQSGRSDQDEETILTNQRGEATLQLNRPSSEGASLVTLTHPDVGEDGTFAVLWSRDNPVVFSAKPSFDLHQNRRSTKISFGVTYDLYDQYGNRLNRRNSNVGRDADSVLGRTLSYSVYPVTKSSGTVGSDAGPVEDKAMQISSSGRIIYDLDTSDDLDNFTPASTDDYFVVITPAIETQDSSNDPVAKYAKPVVVWIVREADDEDDIDIYSPDYRSALDLSTSLDSLDDTSTAISAFTEISVDTGRDEFRTFFTIWEYDSNDDFFDGDDNELTITQFENLLRGGVEVDDLEIRLYSSNSSRLSYFIVTP